MAKTPVQKLYDAFFVLMESDEWEAWDAFQMEIDLQHLAMAAIPWFKFPRCSLEWDEKAEFFKDEAISNTEIQIIAAFMKKIWYSRVIDSWENIRPYYTERDFSPAKQMGEFQTRLEKIDNQAKELEKIYYRSVNGKPFDYTKLAGG